MRYLTRESRRAFEVEIARFPVRARRALRRYEPGTAFMIDGEQFVVYGADASGNLLVVDATGDQEMICGHCLKNGTIGPVRNG